MPKVLDRLSGTIIILVWYPGMSEAYIIHYFLNFYFYYCYLNFMARFFKCLLLLFVTRFVTRLWTWFIQIFLFKTRNKPIWWIDLISGQNGCWNSAICQWIQPGWQWIFLWQVSPLYLSQVALIFNIYAHHGS